MFTASTHSGQIVHGDFLNVSKMPFNEPRCVVSQNYSCNLRLLLCWLRWNYPLPTNKVDKGVYASGCTRMLQPCTSLRFSAIMRQRLARTQPLNFWHNTQYKHCPWRRYLGHATLTRVNVYFFLTYVNETHVGKSITPVQPVSFTGSSSHCRASIITL